MRPAAALPSILIPGVSKPTPLILDDEGRTIDLVTGKAVTLERRGPTLEANKRAKRREDFKAVQEKVADEVKDEQPDFYDARVSTKLPSRSRRTNFKFHDKGTFVKQGHMLRAKVCLGRCLPQKRSFRSADTLATLLVLYFASNKPTLVTDRTNYREQKFFKKRAKNCA